VVVGRPTGVRLVAALVRARGERAAGATGLGSVGSGFVVVGDQRGRQRVVRGLVPEIVSTGAVCLAVDIVNRVADSHILAGQ